MKRSPWRIFLVAAVCMPLVLGPNWALAKTDDDKAMHAIGGFSVNTVSYILMRRAKYSKWQSALGSLVVTSTVGLAKEITDSEFSGADMVANFAGAGASLALCITLDW